MKFRFQAIDSGGRVVRGVLRADSAEEARTFMIDEEVYPKSIEAASEDDAVTWAPRRRIINRAHQHATGSSAPPPPEVPTRALLPTTMITGPGSPRSGTLGLAESHAIIFLPEDGKAEDALRWHRDQLERVSLHGFPARVLRLTLLDGHMVEFTAGFVFAAGAAAAILKQYRNL